MVIGLQMVPPRLQKILVDEVVAPDPTRGPVAPLDTRLLWLMYLVIALFGVQLLTAVVQRHQRPAELASSARRSPTTCATRVFGRLTHLCVDYYDRHSVGQLISRMGNDTEAMKDFVRQATQGFFAQILIVVVTGVMLFSLSWQLALWTLLPAPLVIIASTFYWRRLYPRYFRVWDAWSRMMGCSRLDPVRHPRREGVRPGGARGDRGSRGPTTTCAIQRAARRVHDEHLQPDDGAYLRAGRPDRLVRRRPRRHPAGRG